VPRGTLSAERLRAAVREARGLTDGAARVAEGFRAAGGAPRAVALLEELMAPANEKVEAPAA